MYEKYLLQRVAGVEYVGGYTLRITFPDGFFGELNLAPLIEPGTVFEAWNDEAFFASVKISNNGVPVWGSDEEIDLSPGSLRAWCEAGHLLSPHETDEWIESQSGESSQTLA